MPDAPSQTALQVSRVLRDWDQIHWVEALLVLFAGLFLVGAIKWLAPRLAARLPDRFRLWVLPWEPVVRVLVLLVMVAYLIPLFIYPTPENLLAISGAVAVAVGFAFKDYASSLIAGVVALYERPFRTGDWIEVDGVYGEVTSHNLRTVHLCTADDTMVAIPHSRMWTAPIRNSNDGRRTLLCVADFYLDPDHDGAQVRQLLQDVAVSSPYVNFSKPILVVAAEQPWGTHYRLKAYPLDAREQFQFVTDLTLRGKAMLRSLGVKPAVVAAVPPPRAGG